MSFTPPDWREPANYPSHEEDKSSLSRWAWQFLRRNKDYQAEWGNYVKGLYTAATRVPELLPFVRLNFDEAFQASDEAESLLNRPDEVRKLYELAYYQMEFIDVNPPALLGETLKEYEARIFNPRPGWATVGMDMKNRGYDFRDKRKALGETWGLARLENPGSEHLSISNNFLDSGGSITYLGGTNEYAGNKNYVVPVFDIRFPVSVLKSQFEFILAERDRRIEANKVKPYLSRPSRSLHLYRNYLRAIDANDAGESVANIAKVLLPNQDQEGAQKNIRNWLEAAEKLRDKGYIALVASEEIHVKK